MELAILACLILINGLFAMSEVALLTARKSRLATLAAHGDGSPRRRSSWPSEPTRFLSTIQIGITSIGLLNGIVGDAIFAGAARDLAAGAGAGVEAERLRRHRPGGDHHHLLLIVFGELVPKRLGAAQRRRHRAPGGLADARAGDDVGAVRAPAVGLHRRAPQPLLRLLRIRPQEDGAQPLSAEEIRTIVLESSHILPNKHRSILLNLFDINEITVQDVMVPRAKIEAIRLDDDMDGIARQLTTSYHRELPVFRGSGDEIAGVLNLRKVLGLLFSGALDRKAIEDLLDEPYFVPATTPAIAQLQYFQEKRERIGLVVDEYGELMGLVTLEGIMEEIIGKFTTSLPSASPALSWDDDGAATADGAMAGARGEPRARPRAADRRAEDAQRPDPRAAAGHSGGERLAEDRRRAGRDPERPGPRGEVGAPVPAPRGAAR